MQISKVFHLIEISFNKDFMINNLTISQISLNLLFVSPFITQPILRNSKFNSFNNIRCAKSFYSFLYSTMNIHTTFKSSSFSKFQSYRPIYIDSKIGFSPRSDDKSDFYDQIFKSPKTFAEYLNVSVTFDQCSFLDCINENGQGGAIAFRKERASLIIKSCFFIRCKSYHSSGAIYIIQLYNGYWVDGNVNITNSKFEECCDCDSMTSYVAGVIDAYVSKGDSYYAFSLQNTEFINCQFDKKNKITEAQVRLNANIVHCNYNNFSNNNEKIDSSAIIFVKYIQGKSTISFLNAFNQYGFSFFEIYDLQSGYINVYDITMVNTTFINFNVGSVLKKVAYFNIYFTFEDCFYLDNFFAIDYNLICTDEQEVDYDLVEPVIVKIPDTCTYPNSYNIFSNKKLSKTNQIDYEFFPEMKYDYDHRTILNKPVIKETPTPTPSMSLIPTESIIEPVQTTPYISDLFDSIKNNDNKTKFKIEIIIVAVFGAVVIIASVIIIINIVMKKKRKSFKTNFLNNDENEDHSSNEDSSDKLDENNRIQRAKSSFNDKISYELFYNPNNSSMSKQSDQIKINTMIESLVKDDLFKNDFEEND